MPEPPSPALLPMSDGIVQAHWVATLPIGRGKKISVSFSGKRKQGHRSPSTSDKSDAPSPLRRFAKRLRGEATIDNAVPEKPRLVHNAVVWNMLAKHRKSTRDENEITDENETTDENGHRARSWVRKASGWSEQTCTASLDNTTVLSESSDTSRRFVRALTQNHTATQDFVIPNEMDDTRLTELMDTLPRAVLPETPLLPVDIVDKHSCRAHFEDLDSAEGDIARDDKAFACQRQSTSPARSRPISGSVDTEGISPSDYSCLWSGVAPIQSFDGSPMTTEDEDGKDGPHLSGSPAHNEAVRRSSCCEGDHYLVPPAPDGGLSSHDGTSPYLMDYMVAQQPRNGQPLDEPRAMNRSLDGAPDDAPVLGSPDTADGVSHATADGVSHATADGNKLEDSCSYVAGEDFLESQKPAEKITCVPELMDVRSLGSLDDSEEGSSLESSSIWLSEFSDDMPKLKPAHPFLGAKDLALRQMLDGFEGWQACLAGAGSQANGTSGTWRSSSLNSSGEGASKKRQRKPSQSGGRHDKGQLPEEHRASTKRRRTADRKVTFACPYSKKEPMRHRDCYKYMLTRIRDVKQHLTRCHRMPMYCPRCFEIFETEDSRDGHIVQMNCTPTAAKPDGITEAQRQQLSQKSPANLSNEDQWFGVWDILFPGTPKPASPYIDSELFQDITLYQDFLTTSGPQILSNVLAQRGAVITWSMPNEERDLAAFQQTILEEGLRVVFNQWAGLKGIGRQSSTATLSSCGSASRNAPLSSDSTPGAAQLPSIQPQTSPTMPAEPEPYGIPDETIFDRTQQTDSLPTTKPDRPRAPDIIPDLMRQADFMAVRQPEHGSFQRTMHGIIPHQVDAAFLYRPYVPGLPERLEEVPRFPVSRAASGEMLEFENDDLLIDYRGDDRAVMPSVGLDEENRELMTQAFNVTSSFQPSELDFRVDVG